MLRVILRKNTPETGSTLKYSSREVINHASDLAESLCLAVFFQLPDYPALPLGFLSKDGSALELIC